MNNSIFSVSSQFELPYWWVESIAIEYLNCREFATRDEIWTFNFDLISKQDLIKAVKTEKIVVSSPIIQYPPLQKNLVKSLEYYFLGLDDDAEGFFIEGPVSRDNFPKEVEFLDFWDPKLSFSDYFQVYDEGKFWQWKIAESIPIKGKSYSRWVSSEIDLIPINDMDIELRKLRNNIVKPGEPGNAEFKLKVEGYYLELENIRTEILSKLWKIHQKRRIKWIEKAKE